MTLIITTGPVRLSAQELLKFAVLSTQELLKFAVFFVSWAARVKDFIFAQTQHLSTFIEIYRPLVPLKHRWNTILRRSCQHNQFAVIANEKNTTYDQDEPLRIWSWLDRARDISLNNLVRTSWDRWNKLVHSRIFISIIPTEAYTQPYDNANGAHPRGPTWLR